MSKIQKASAPLLSIDNMYRELQKGFGQIKDHRRNNSSYSLPDILSGAFAMFSLKSASLLDFSFRSSQEDKNLLEVYTIKKLCWDTQMREVLDQVKGNRVRDFYDSNKGVAIIFVIFLIFTYTLDSGVCIKFAYCKGMRLTSKQARDFRWQTVVRLYQAGKKQHQIGELLLISQSSVSRIIHRYEQNPTQVITTKSGRGSKKKLSEQALAEVKSWASKTAVAFGFQGQYWTRARFKALIKEQFGVEYQLSGVGNLLKSLQITLQKPILKDYRQQPQQLAEWKAEKLPDLKKKPTSNKAR